MYNLYFWNGDFYLSEMFLLDFILASRNIAKGNVLYQKGLINPATAELLIEQGIKNFDERYPEYVDYCTGL